MPNWAFYPQLDFCVLVLYYVTLVTLTCKYKEQLHWSLDSSHSHWRLSVSLITVSHYYFFFSISDYCGSLNTFNHWKMVVIEYL